MLSSPCILRHFGELVVHQCERGTCSGMIVASVFASAKASSPTRKFAPAKRKDAPAFRDLHDQRRKPHQVALLSEMAGQTKIHRKVETHARRSPKRREPPPSMKLFGPSTLKRHS
jgi:hypothetical protein